MVKCADKCEDRVRSVPAVLDRLREITEKLDAIACGLPNRFAGVLRELEAEDEQKVWPKPDCPLAEEIQSAVVKLQNVAYALKQFENMCEL